MLITPSTIARPAISFSTNLQHNNWNISDGNEPPNKRRRIEESTPQQSLLSYWPNGPEACQVFRPRTIRTRMRTAGSSDDDGNTMTLCGESAKVAVEQKIKLLQSMHEQEDNWQSIVMG
jgi:hypothetical protein